MKNDFFLKNKKTGGLSRIPSSTDGWMDYVPISEKKKKVDSAQLKEGETVSILKWEFKIKSPVQSFRTPKTHPCCPVAGGPLVYDSVQLVQNSAALNGSQRVLLDHVISEQECSDLRHLAHVRVSHFWKSPVVLLNSFQLLVLLQDCTDLALKELTFSTLRLSPWQETVTEAGCLLTPPMRSLKAPRCWKHCGYQQL